ncbi:MAG: hypothetical protein QM820_56225 [Minicystis sp.]
MHHRLTTYFLASTPILILAGQLGCGGGAGGSGGSGGSAAPKSIDCVHQSSIGKDYEVGPGLAYPDIGSVPWETLGPGDSVRIHYTEGGYHEKILLSTRGTESDPILVCGIPDESGGAVRLPIIDGKDATTRPSLPYGQSSGIEATSLVAVYNNDAAKPGGKRPGYITIANLEIRGARHDNGFTTAAGVKVPYSSIGPAAVNVFGADHVSLIGSVLTDSDMGLFVNSKDYVDAGGYDYAQSRDIVVQGNTFTDNGMVNNYLVHHAYTEAIGITFEYNFFGRLKDYAQGNAISDRSVGTVIRYNAFDGGAHFATIENPQASWANVKKNLEEDPSLRLTYVYGNVFLDRRNPNVNTGYKDPPEQFSGYSSKMFMYGGTDKNYESYRNGTLYFYNNTIVVEADNTKQYNTFVFEVYTDPSTPLAAKVDARNNIFVVRPETKGAQATALLLTVSNNGNFGDSSKGQGDILFDTNWVNTGWAPSFPKSEYYDPTTASIQTMNFIEGATGAEPGFVDFAGGDFHLKAGSAAIDRGISLESSGERGRAGRDLRVRLSGRRRAARGEGRGHGSRGLRGEVTIVPQRLKTTTRRALSSAASRGSARRVFVDPTGIFTTRSGPSRVHFGPSVRGTIQGLDRVMPMATTSPLPARPEITAPSARSLMPSLVEGS